jgi:ABC-type antimicrobial peptide transport system permease subunit
VLGGAARLLMFGIAAGLLCSIAVARLLRSVLFDVSPVDPATLALAVLALAAVSIAAAFVPARRAGAIDPIEAMRAE